MREAMEKGLFDEIMVQKSNHTLELKTNLHFDYPSERGALARLKIDDPKQAERFELYMGGLEIANAFSELTDAEEQRKRFCSEEAQRRLVKKQPYPIPVPHPPR
jgi:lysyl-tRNA synthetase class 2